MDMAKKKKNIKKEVSGKIVKKEMPEEKFNGTQEDRASVQTDEKVNIESYMRVL